MEIIIAIAAVIVFSIIAFLLGISYRKKIAEAELGSAEEQAKTLVNDAVKAAESKKREILLEAKEESHSLKSELEKELKERRGEIQRQERRIQQKEENLARKVEPGHQMRLHCIHVYLVKGDSAKSCLGVAPPFDSCYLELPVLYADCIVISAILRGIKN